MRCEVVAIGTELLLGQIVDTNSAWMGEQLALAGIDVLWQTKVGDNRGRMVEALRIALGRNDAVICCGGLGPTQDDITREAIADVMGVELVRDPVIEERIAEMFRTRGRTMAANNARQADVPVGAGVIEQVRGTAPGLICPIGPVRADGRSEKVIYAVPGVPHEMREMLERAVLPDLQSRAGARSAIVSRVLRTWGESESALAERIAHRLDALEGGPTTLAFLASGIEGIKVRITAKGADVQEARRLVEAEEVELRAILGDLVFGVDQETMEHAVGALVHGSGRTIGLAESLTGGLAASRVCDEPGSSEWFRGAVVSYASEVKWDVLGLPHGCRVVTAEAAGQMAQGARRVLGADIGLGVTGVAGPAEQEGVPVGTVFVGIALGDDDVSTHELHLPGDRDRVRQFATIGMFDLLRRRLLAG